MAINSNYARRIVAPILTRIRQNEALRSLIRKLRYAVRNIHPETTGTLTWENASHAATLPEHIIDFRKMVPVTFDSKIGFIAAPHDPLIPYFHQTLKTLNIEGDIFDPYRADFHDRILSHRASHIFLSRPQHATNLERQLFWEKTYALYQMVDLPVFPKAHALSIYEAKRELAYFLRIHAIPHPETHVFCNLAEALEFSDSCRMPQVFKTNTGAASVGVEVLRDRRKLKSLIRDIFKRHYVKKSMLDARDIDYGCIILQEFISPVREFRVIKIGESWFGHEKLPSEKSELMSGSGINAWTPPPHALLDFCAEIAQKHSFSTMCFDIFQNGSGSYLVNELQVWFGSYNNSQMYIDNVPGRYIQKDGVWVFEPGYFNQYRSLPLIIIDAILNSTKAPA